MTRTEQIQSHGVDAAKTPFASFCYGRGWKGHASAESAWKSASRDARRAVKNHGGGIPDHMVVETATGKPIS